MSSNQLLFRPFLCAVAKRTVQVALTLSLTKDMWVGLVGFSGVGWHTEDCIGWVSLSMLQAPNNLQLIQSWAYWEGSLFKLWMPWPQGGIPSRRHSWRQWLQTALSLLRSGRLCPIACHPFFALLNVRRKQKGSGRGYHSLWLQAPPYHSCLSACSRLLTGTQSNQKQKQKNGLLATCLSAKVCEMLLSTPVAVAKQISQFIGEWVGSYWSTTDKSTKYLSSEM